MQLISSRIWTRVAVSISYDDNHYTTTGIINFKSYSTKNYTTLVHRDSQVTFWGKGMDTTFCHFSIVFCL